MAHRRFRPPIERLTCVRAKPNRQRSLGLGIFLHSQLPSAAGPAANSPKHWARSEVPDHSKTDDGRSPPACLRSTAELPRAHGRSHSGRVCRCASHKTCASSDSESSCSVSPKSSTRTEAAPVSTDVAATAMASAGNHGGSSLYRRRNPRVCHVSLSSISTHCAQAVTTDKTRSGRCSRALDRSSLTRSADVTRDPSQNIEWPLASSASQSPVQTNRPQPKAWPRQTQRSPVVQCVHGLPPCGPSRQASAPRRTVDGDVHPAPGGLRARYRRRCRPQPPRVDKSRTTRWRSRTLRAGLQPHLLRQWPARTATQHRRGGGLPASMAAPYQAVLGAQRVDRERPRRSLVRAPTREAPVRFGLRARLKRAPPWPPIARTWRLQACHHLPTWAARARSRTRQ